jgi:spectinomycin phosphotransferase
MLEKPDLDDEHITIMLGQDYRLSISRLEFLPLGADLNTAVYRAYSANGETFFLKLRKGVFEAVSVLAPDHLHRQGIRQVIPLLPARDGALWTHLDGFTCLLYPFIEGTNGFEQALTDSQWVEFGGALRAIHNAELPAALREMIPGETYASHWRDLVRSFLHQAGYASDADALSARLARFLIARQDEIRMIVDQAERLASRLQAEHLPLRLCHSDLHAGNLLLAPDGGLYIVDWDNPILAPAERDLMFIGGGVGGIWNSARESALFYQGYGAVEIHRTALAYYRFERIVQDIAAFCEEIFLEQAGRADREQALRYLVGQFEPGEVVDMAFRTEME